VCVLCGGVCAMGRERWHLYLAGRRLVNAVAAREDRALCGGVLQGKCLRGMVNRFGLWKWVEIEFVVCWQVVGWLQWSVG
jgi:hypothetical protein